MDGTSTGNEEDPKSTQTKRTALTRNACTVCRTAKTKCNGQRPSCIRCQAKQTQCVYDLQDGATRMQDFRRKLNDKESENKQMSLVIHKLREGSDAEANDLLALLRTGVPIDEVMDALNSPNSSAIMSLTGALQSSSNHELPYYGAESSAIQYQHTASFATSTAPTPMPLDESSYGNAPQITFGGIVDSRNMPFNKDSVRGSGRVLPSESIVMGSAGERSEKVFGSVDGACPAFYR